MCGALETTTNRDAGHTPPQHRFQAAPPSEPWRARLHAAPGWAIAVVVGLLYVGLAQYVLWLNDPVRHGAGFWPSAGVTLAAFLLLPRTRWAWVAVAVVVGELVSDTILSSYPIAPSAWWAAANLAEPLLAALLLTRRPGAARLVPSGNLMRFLAFGVVAGPLLGATLGTTGTAAEYGVPWLSTWAKFAVGDGLGVLVVAPALLWVAQPPNARRSRGEALTVSTVVVAMVVGQLRWTGDLEIVMPYLMIPLLIWTGMRFGVRGTAVAGFALANGANFANAVGSGPRVLDVSDGQAITLLQLFIGIALITGLVIAVLLHDLLEQAEVQRLLAHQTRHDALTGLPNRTLLMERLQTSLHHARAAGHGVGLLFVDLDRFKSINDRLGHDAGDAVLCEMARRLERSCRPRDTVARFGGDEFVVLCPDLDAGDDLQEIAVRLVEVAAQPFDLAGRDVLVGASVGVVTAAADRTAQDLLRDGDAAMYLAKARGRSTFVHASSTALE